MDARPVSALIVVSLASSAPALAERTSWHGTLTTDAAATDNVSSASSFSNREVDLFFQVRPGLMFTYGAPRMIHELGADLEVMDYMRQGDEPTVSFRGGWRALFVPGPRSQMSLSAAGGTGVLTGISTRSTPDQTTLDLRPVGNPTVRNADASESASYTATRELQLRETLFARWSETDDQLVDPTVVTTAEAGATLGFDRQFLNDALGLEAGGSVLRMERIAPVGALMASRLDRQIVPRARLFWRHDIDRKYSTSIDVGGAYVYPYGSDPHNPDATDRKPGLFPIVGGLLAYTDTWGLGTLTVRRDVSPNMLLAQNTLNDSAVVAAAMPLPWLSNGNRLTPRLLGMGTFGMQRTQLIDSVTSDPVSSFIVARVDVGVMYNARPGVSYGARYEFMYQTGDDEAAMPLPGFWRNTLYFTLNVRYPAEVAAEIPKRRKNSARADRSDTGLGAEPVVPEEATE